VKDDLMDTLLPDESGRGVCSRRQRAQLSSAEPLK
jgi:hypothetical protein